MPWRSLVRTSSALRVAPVLFVWLVMYSGNMTGWITDGYWPSVVSQSTFLLNFTAPAVAACGAWEALKVRRSAVPATAPARSSATIALSVLAPVLVLGAVSVLLAVALFVPQASGFPGWSVPVVLLLELLVVLAHAAAGYVLGLALPRLLAVPLVLVASFGWMAYPSTLDAFWVRQLNGRNLTECCALDQVPATRAVCAAAVAALGPIAAAWLWNALRAPLRLTAFLALAAATAAGAWIAEPLGFRAAQPRSASEQTCTEGTPQVCLWPEQRSAGADITDWATQAQQRLAAVGVTRLAPVEPLSDRPTHEEIQSLVALRSVPDHPPQCAAGRGARWPGARAVAPLAAWLELTAGVALQPVEARYGESPVRLARQVMALPAEEQHAWFQRNASTLTGCDAEPDLDPSHFHQAVSAQPGAAR
ncbi:hypothetical protein OU787_01760 [Kitasatospora sp. YST-16]|uniref:DUF7224 domain-containing protein n=1 Tax=Kitasatospora sp. YST-16 TaxID=2998080 RepID=UPI002283CFD8|nr:hypothetical protein [Kitasatospora sp. YST-16]WAL70325.1 hypothetical protein OU787_01760 [Kitasatospora sp. YST-16]WNW36368.1 hypothetical protein RKE32_01775 [Streptomyces sp. Li-HN-5-13]